MLPKLTLNGSEPVLPAARRLQPLPQAAICRCFILAATNGWLSRAAANREVGGKDRCAVARNVLSGLVARRLLADANRKAEKHLSCLALEVGISGKCDHEVIRRM